MKNMQPLARLVFGVISLLIISSCAIIPDPHEIPWTDRVYIHENPKPGDFVIHVHESGDYENRWQVEKVKGNIAEVSLRVDVHVMGVDLEYKQFFVVDREGNVLDAWVRYDDGRIESRPVAGQGQQGGLHNLQRLAVSPDYRITTGGGEFEIDAGYSYSVVKDLGLGTTRSIRIDYLSSDVPFRVVRTLDQGSFDSGTLLSLMQSAAFSGSAQLSSASARLFEQTIDGNMDSFDVIELQRFGNEPPSHPGPGLD